MAIQTGGSLEAAVDMAMSNNISITDQPTVGQIIANPEAVNSQVTNYYSKRNLTPATGLNAGESGEGIEFWIVERDFIVS